MGFWEDLISRYNNFQARRMQHRIAREESKARIAYYRSREYRQRLSENVSTKFPYRVKEVDVNKRVAKPEIDAEESELLETYGTAVWVYAACNAIAEKSASIEPQLMDTEGEVLPVNDEVLSRLEKPNPLMSRFDLFELTQLWLDLSGNAYWYVPTDEQVIYPMRPTKMAIVPEENGRGGIAGYAYNKKGFDRSIRNSGFQTNNRIAYDDFKYAMRVAKGLETERKAAFVTGNWIPYEKEEIIHFKYQHPFNDYYGMSPLQPLLLSLESELYARGWNKRFFENGAIPLGIMIVPDTIDPADFQNLKETWEKEHGQGSEHKTGWLNTEIKYEQLEAQPKDLEFLNLIRMTREDTLAVLNVPPVMVGIFEFANSSSRSAGVREQRQIFWQDCIMPKLKKIYDRLNLYFYADSEHYLAPNFEDLEILQPEWTEVAKGAKDALLGGLSVEEVRELFWKKTNDPPGPIYLPSTLLPTTVDIEDETETDTEQTGYELVDVKKNY